MKWCIGNEDIMVYQLGENMGLNFNGGKGFLWHHRGQYNIPSEGSACREIKSEQTNFVHLNFYKLLPLHSPIHVKERLQKLHFEVAFTQLMGFNKESLFYVLMPDGICIPNNMIIICLSICFLSSQIFFIIFVCFLWPRFPQNLAFYYISLECPLVSNIIL